MLTLVGCWLLVVAFTGLFANRYLTSALRETALDDVGQHAVLRQEALARFTAERFNDLALAAALLRLGPQGESRGESTASLVAVRDQNDCYGSLRVLDAHGTVVIDTDMLAVGTIDARHHRLPADGRYALQFDYSERRERSVAWFGHRLSQSNGRSYGWLVAEVPLERFERIIAGAESWPAGAIVQLLDPLGQVIFTQGDQTALGTSRPAALTGAGAVRREELPDGSVRVIAGPSQRVTPDGLPAPTLTLRVELPKSAFMRPVQVLRRVLVSALALALLLGLVGSWWLVSRFDRPLQRLALQSRQLMLGAGRQIEISPHEPTEVVELARALNNSANELRTRMEELLEARDAAEAGARAKAEFLAVMSHEIRTPLNGVIGMSEILMDRELDSETAEIAQTIRSSGEALLQLVNDILDFSKIEAGRLELESVAFDARDLARQVKDLFGVQALRRGLAVRLDWPAAESQFFVGDPGRLRQILLNLTGNAVKFTEKGQVTIGGRWLAPSALAPNGFLQLAVQDTGIGIPEDKLHRLFKSFSQVDASTARRFGGTGLGLAITKRLTEAMNGTITVDSTEAVGTTFFVTLPLVRMVGAEEIEQLTGPRPGREQPSARGGLVLIAEDNPINRKVIAAMLQKFGVQYTMAGNGSEAVEAWERESPELILMDMQMPEVDGLEATRRIRALEAERHLPPTPIVALTANVFDDDRRACLAAGMQDFLSKPINRTAVAQVLDRYLAAPVARAG